jgi:hypothetical protein
VTSLTDSNYGTLFSIRNTGTVAFNITSFTLTPGVDHVYYALTDAAHNVLIDFTPYATTGARTATGVATVPIPVPAGGSVAFYIKPQAIPATLAGTDLGTSVNKFRASLSFTTNVDGDTGRSPTQLNMYAQGVIIDNTVPILPTWNFGTVEHRANGSNWSEVQLSVFNHGNVQARASLVMATSPTPPFALIPTPSLLSANPTATLPDNFIARYTPLTCGLSWSLPAQVQIIADTGSSPGGGPLFPTTGETGFCQALPVGSPANTWVTSVTLVGDTDNCH